MLEHTGAHILHDSMLANDDSFCGFCARPASQCTIYLRRSGNGTIQVDLKRSTCPLVRSGANLKYGPASQSTKTSPCSNVPVFCVACGIFSPGSTGVVWKYNVRQHYLAKHSGQINPAWLSSSHPDAPWALDEDEESRMDDLWQKIRLSKKQTAISREAPPKPRFEVSEAHTTSVALS